MFLDFMGNTLNKTEQAQTIIFAHRLTFCSLNSPMALNRFSLDIQVLRTPDFEKAFSEIDL